MKRFKIILLIPHTREVVVRDVQEAHNEATRLAEADGHDGLKATVHSVEEIGEVQTEEIDFGDTNTS